MEGITMKNKKEKRCGNCTGWAVITKITGTCWDHGLITRQDQTCCYPNDFKPLKAKERRHAKHAKD